MQSSINIIQENNSLIITKKGHVKLPLFCGNGKQVITNYGWYKELPKTFLSVIIDTTHKNIRF